MWFNKENVTPLCPFYICIHTHTIHMYFRKCGKGENLSVSPATPSISGQLVRVASLHTCYGNSQIKWRSIISLSRHSSSHSSWITYQRIKFFGFIWECQMLIHCPLRLSHCLSHCIPPFVYACDCPFPFHHLQLVGCLSVLKWPCCLFISVIDWFSVL